MKKYFILFTFLFLASCSKEQPQAPMQEPLEAPSKAAEQAPPIKSTSWLENTHYLVLDHDASDTPQVQEFFSFWCPHCHRFEPVVALIKKELPKGAEFKKVHVDFMGFTTQDIQQSATKAMLMAKFLGKEDVINRAIFEHIHIKQQAIEGMSDIKSLFLANDISDDEFENAMKSSEVSALLDEHYSTFLTYRPSLKSVPTFIINGKYQAKFTQEMDVNDMVNLIVWLTTQ